MIIYLKEKINFYIMAKQATTVEEQIALLEGRGMIISNRAKAREHLLDIGYYRLGFYWYYFLKDEESQQFYSNTDITDAIDLYYLDVDLRNLLLKYIYRIEVHFRTQLVYYMSNKYKEDSTWFCNPEVVDNFNPNIYNKLKETNIYIIKHHNKYPDEDFAPAWKNLEFLMFGQILRTFNNIKDTSIKSEIASIYGLQDRKVNKRNKRARATEISIKDHIVLSDYLTGILNIRNICSHSGVLFDYKQPTAIRRIPDSRYRTKGSSPERLDTSINLIYFFLSKISMNRTNELIASVKDVLNKAIIKNEKLKDIISTHSGFNI